MTTKYYCNIGLGKHLEKKILNKYLDVLTLEKNAWDKYHEVW